MRTTYVYDNGKLVEKGARERRTGYSVISDIEPFTSPIDGSILSSRSQVREHERKHQVRQCGNDYTSSEKPSWWDSRHG